MPRYPGEYHSDQVPVPVRKITNSSFSTAASVDPDSGICVAGHTSFEYH
jgi:hypothetical protein